MLTGLEIRFPKVCAETLFDKAKDPLCRENSQLAIKRGALEFERKRQKLISANHNNVM